MPLDHPDTMIRPARTELPAPLPDFGRRTAVAAWLLAIAGMILVMIVLGGTTRLTGSGLSIMEWAPLSGAVPPLSGSEWQRLFDLYRAIPQYSLVNDGLSLAGFKQIFWLEWVHRLWGRLLGVAFVLPLAWFWWRRQIDARLAVRLAWLGVLGMLQGGVGWFMVASGFLPDSTSVSPGRLVAHLVLALLLYAAVLWTALTLLGRRPATPPVRGMTGRLALLTLGLVALTIVAGGFVAGLHAGLIYNTFPLMDGRLVPARFDALSPFIRNLTENVAAVQFDHRALASLTVLSALVTAGVGLSRRDGPRLALLALGGAALAQFGLGVATLLLVVPIPLAVAHQAMAALLLTAAVVTVHRTRRADRRQGSRP